MVCSGFFILVFLLLYHIDPFLNRVGQRDARNSALPKSLANHHTQLHYNPAPKQNPCYVLGHDIFSSYLQQVSTNSSAPQLWHRISSDCDQCSQSKKHFLIKLCISGPSGDPHHYGAIKYTLNLYCDIVLIKAQFFQQTYKPIILLVLNIPQRKVNWHPQGLFKD